MKALTHRRQRPHRESDRVTYKCVQRSLRTIFPSVSKDRLGLGFMSALRGHVWHIIIIRAKREERSVFREFDEIISFRDTPSILIHRYTTTQGTLPHHYYISIYDDLWI